MNAEIELPDGETLITVYGGRCQECDLEVPNKNPEYVARLKAAADAWRRQGLGHLVREYPLELPARMVRVGFRCPVCNAPNMLLALTPELPR